MYTCFVVCFVVKETGVLTTKHGYIICQSEFLHFKGSCASIYVLSFLI